MQVVYNFSQPGLQWKQSDHLHSLMTVTSRDWLLDRGSLTRRLRVLSDDDLEVVPLREEVGVILPHEADVLGLQLGAIGGVREVYLVGFGRPWVFARSIIVNSGSIEEGSALLQLGNMPLGDLLFGDGSFQRSEIEVCRYHDACNASARSTYPLWARRSVFKREKTHVLVQEMFLPALWEEMS